MEFPILYHKAKTGSIHSWQVWSFDDKVFTEHGLVNGKKQISSFVCYEKNTGKKNATTAEQQADKEAAAMHKHKLERKYSLTPEEACEPSLLPMLAHDFWKKQKKCVYPAFIQPKLDGLRCLAKWNGDKVELTSRNGKLYNHPLIEKELESILPQEGIFDGELYIHGIGFQSITSWVKKWDSVNSPKVQYHIYDIPQMEDDGILYPFSDRMEFLQEMDVLIHELNLQSVKIVDTIKVNDESEVLREHSNFVAMGYEGVMFRNSEGIYTFGYRSDDLLKVKTFRDEEFKIVGATEGIGKDAGTVIWICRTYDGKQFSVRSSATYEQRKEWWENQYKYIGSFLKVKFFEMSDDGIPRFPVGIGIRIEEDM